MSADNDVTDLENLDRELQDRQTIEVGVHDQVGHIAMNK